jgi:acetylornithine deacetylase/succinyl-diaminopimelate desuccinylase-like protein
MNPRTLLLPAALTAAGTALAQPAQALPNIVAFGPIFPGEEVREHKPDEYISVDSLMRNAQIIAAATYEMAK